MKKRRRTGSIEFYLLPMIAAYGSITAIPIGATACTGP